MNRKTFIKNTAMIGAGGMFLPNLKGYALSKSSLDISANDQINIGSIGINGMGWKHAKSNWSSWSKSCSSM